MKRRILLTGASLFLAVSLASGVPAASPAADSPVTTIHLDEYNGYFAARETLARLKPGEYEFVVHNKAEKLVGFWLQDAKTQAFLDRFPLEPGETRKTRVTVSENGFRYRCPINPTPWYEVSVSQ